MATRIASAAAGHPVDWRAVGEARAARPWRDAGVHGRRRVAAAMVLGVTGILFVAPPTVAVLVITGLLR